jgi:hypothetical protein
MNAFRPALAGRKYRNVPTEVDGILFASKREARRWSELRLMERAGYITELQRQVRFPLDVNGQPICHYVCDFQYRRNGELVVEDSKGVRTPEYKLKAKLMKAVHQIQIVEV